MAGVLGSRWLCSALGYVYPQPQRWEGTVSQRCKCGHDAFVHDGRVGCYAAGNAGGDAIKMFAGRFLCPCHTYVPAELPASVSSNKTTGGET
jgi:hypothetical protein